MDVNDVELFSTTDIESKTKAVSILVRNRISYLERWEKIPLLKRREYSGAKQLCVIYVNGNQYDKAKKILDEFNQEYFGRSKHRRKGRGDRAERSDNVREAADAAGAAADGMQSPDAPDDGIDRI